jgi:hypothetical protein
LEDVGASEFVSEIMQYHRDGNCPDLTLGAESLRVIRDGIVAHLDDYVVDGDISVVVVKQTGPDHGRNV